jgi:acetyl esterase
MTVPTKYASDPELAAAVAGLPELDFSDVAAARAHLTATLSQLPAPDTTGLTITDRTVPGPEGAPDVAVRIYRPDSQTAPIGILAVHAGGFILGNLEASHPSSMAMVRGVGAVVVAVDYRLAPENPYPAGLEAI